MLFLKHSFIVQLDRLIDLKLDLSLTSLKFCHSIVRVFEFLELHGLCIFHLKIVVILIFSLGNCNWLTCMLFLSLLYISLSALIHRKSVALGLLLTIGIRVLIFILMHLSTVEYVHRDARPIRHVSRNFGDLPDSVHSFDDLAENDMLAVQVLALLKRDEELR